jgi:hypothetical protein
VERYIGLDVHAASTTFAVIGESGKRLGTHVVETNGQSLVEQLKTIPGTKHVVLEEGTQSAWMYEILSPHAAEVIVTMVLESRGHRLGGNRGDGEPSDRDRGRRCSGRRCRHRDRRRCSGHRCRHRDRLRRR